MIKVISIRRCDVVFRVGVTKSKNPRYAIMAIRTF